MDIIIGGRRNGKTTAIIKKSAETFSYIVCMDENECHRIFRQSQKMMVDIPYPITFDELLKRLCHGVELKCITLKDKALKTEGVCDG